MTVATAANVPSHVAGSSVVDFDIFKIPGDDVDVLSDLARTELRIFLEEWLSYLPESGIIPCGKPVTGAGKILSVKYLPLSW